MFKTLKQHFRILPLVIFIAALTLSVRINSLFDMLKKPTAHTFSITQSSAFAKEKATQATADLDHLLEASDSTSRPRTIGDSKSTSGFTNSEIMILQELAERREALDIRSREIDKKAVQLRVAEQGIDKRLHQLQDYEERLRKLVKEYNEKEHEKISALVKVYSSMKPKDAARIFNTLDLDVTVSLLKDMKPSTSSAILSQMKPERAKDITDRIIGNNF